MKINIKNTLNIFVAISFLLPLNSQADYPKTDLDYLGLPIYCKEMHQKGNQGTARALQWEKRLAGNGGIHHYCAGLFTYNLAFKTSDKEERGYKLKAALNEMSYPFEHGIDPNFVLLPKMYYDVGKVQEALEDYQSALESYQKSIEMNPKVWMTYVAISDLQLKLNKTKEAIDTLQKGLEHKPDSKPLLKRLAKLKK
jgi:tetratricopeptide (TPR) repeat protein